MQSGGAHGLVGLGLSLSNASPLGFGPHIQVKNQPMGVPARMQNLCLVSCDHTGASPSLFGYQGKIGPCTTKHSPIQSPMWVSLSLGQAGQAHGHTFKMAMSPLQRQRAS